MIIDCIFFNDKNKHILHKFLLWIKFASNRSKHQNNCNSAMLHSFSTNIYSNASHFIPYRTRWRVALFKHLSLEIMRGITFCGICIVCGFVKIMRLFYLFTFNCWKCHWTCILACIHLRMYVHFNLFACIKTTTSYLNFWFNLLEIEIEMIQCSKFK